MEDDEEEEKNSFHNRVEGGNTEILSEDPNVQLLSPAIG